MHIKDSLLLIMDVFHIIICSSLIKKKMIGLRLRNHIKNDEIIPILQIAQI